MKRSMKPTVWVSPKSPRLLQRETREDFGQAMGLAGKKPAKKKSARWSPVERVTADGGMTPSEVAEAFPGPIFWVVGDK